MKIEAGKFYKRKDGVRMEAFGKDGWDRFIVAGDDNSLHRVDSNGYYNSIHGQHKLDLISLWEEPSEVKLPEKLDLNKKCRMYDHKIGHTKNAIYVAPTGAVLETEFIINQLIDFCESLQARVKELENGK